MRRLSLCCCCDCCLDAGVCGAEKSGRRGDGVPLETPLADEAIGFWAWVVAGPIMLLGGSESGRESVEEDGGREADESFEDCLLVEEDRAGAGFGAAGRDGEGVDLCGRVLHGTLRCSVGGRVGNSGVPLGSSPGRALDLLLGNVLDRRSSLESNGGLSDD